MWEPKCVICWCVKISSTKCTLESNTRSHTTTKNIHYNMCQCAKTRLFNYSHTPAPTISHYYNVFCARNRERQSVGASSSSSSSTQSGCNEHTHARARARPDSRTRAPVRLAGAWPACCSWWWPGRNHARTYSRLRFSCALERSSGHELRELLALVVVTRVHKTNIAFEI